MTATVYQTLGGNYGNGLESSDDRASWPYIIWDATSDADAMDALIAAAPTTYDGLPALNYEVEPSDRDGLWNGRVTYGKRRVSPPTVVDPADPTLVSFDTGGQQVHVTNSVEKIASYTAEAGSSAAAPDVGLAVGVTDSGIEGVDVIVPAYTYEITKGFAAATVDGTYRGTLMSLTGKVNSDTFDGMAAGQVLFLGARGSRRGTGADDSWEITFRFSVQVNKTNFNLKLWDKETQAFVDTTIPSKKGWEYLWTYSEPCLVPFGDGTRIEIRPTYAYIDQVFETAAFSALGLA